MSYYGRVQFKTLKLPVVLALMTAPDSWVLSGRDNTSPDFYRSTKTKYAKINEISNLYEERDV
jgi:hypothetical protein